MLETQQHHATCLNGLPSWFRQDLPDLSKIKKLQLMFRDRSLATVCESAHCPNMGQCWERGVATLMILGDVCTRACRFCAVASGDALCVDPQEPMNVAQVVKQLGLRYVVVTSVTRDDLDDEGAGQFVKTVKALRRYNPDIKIELLVPDFSGRIELIKMIIDARPDVFAHNIEMAKEVFARIRPQANYYRSLAVLKTVKNIMPGMLVKTGFMVGLGEAEKDIECLLSDISRTGCDMLTIGQYLAPSTAKRHIPVDRFVDPETFNVYKKQALSMGLKHVFSGPLVRSSFIAEQGYQECLSKLS